MTLLQTLISGLLLGGIYALISMGLNLILGVIRIINFAHGEFLMIAKYMTVFFYVFWGPDPYLSALLVIICLFNFGMIIQRVMIQPIFYAPASTKIFATLGLSIALQNLALLTLSANHYSVRTTYQTADIQMGDLAISVPRLVAFIVALPI